MAPVSVAFLPRKALSTLLPRLQYVRAKRRWASTAVVSRYRSSPLPLPRGATLANMTRGAVADGYGSSKADGCTLAEPHQIPIFPSLPSTRNVCPEPLKAFTASQLARLDPTSARTRLFSKANPDAAHPGDVLLVRFRKGSEPLAGVILSIRRRGVDSSILLRNNITRVGVEAWIKIYSPTVASMEIVERAAKRPRRERLYYMRQPKHDRGPLDGVVANYIRMKRTFGRGVGGVSRKGNKQEKKESAAKDAK